MRGTFCRATWITRRPPTPPPPIFKVGGRDSHAPPAPAPFVIGCRRNEREGACGGVAGPSGPINAHPASPASSDSSRSLPLSLCSDCSPASSVSVCNFLILHTVTKSRWLHWSWRLAPAQHRRVLHERSVFSVYEVIGSAITSRAGAAQLIGAARQVLLSSYNPLMIVLLGFFFFFKCHVFCQTCLYQHCFICLFICCIRWLSCK